MDPRRAKATDVDPRSAKATDGDPDRYRTDQILLFGDSITQHSFNPTHGFAFGAALADEYIRRLDVVNRGFSGYNTRQALRVLPHLLPSPPPLAPSLPRLRILTLFFGANDSRLPDTPGGPQQHIPLPDFAQNLHGMLAHPRLRLHAGVRVALITPPPVDERMCLAADRASIPDLGAVVRRRAAVTRRYARAVVQVGAEAGVPVVDLWGALVRRAGGRGEDEVPVGASEQPVNELLQAFLRDGLHLSAEGYRVLSEEFRALVAREWPDQRAEALPFVLPRWDSDVWEEDQ